MAMSAPSRTVWDLAGMLRYASHVLTTQLTAALAEINLSPRMQSVLMHALEQQRTQIQLAEAAHLDKTTMILTVNALEKVGYLQRQRSQLDRRARIIVVTETGARMAAAGQEIVDRVHGEALALLPPQQREIFAEALRTLAAGLPAKGPPGSSRCAGLTTSSRPRFPELAFHPRRAAEGRPSST